MSMSRCGDSWFNCERAALPGDVPDHRQAGSRLGIRRPVRDLPRHHLSEYFEKSAEDLLTAEGQLSEPEEWFGYLWPPGRMEQLARPGHVSYRPEAGIKVRLIGGFDVHILRAVHGSFERIPITLVDCVATFNQMQGFDSLRVRQDVESGRLLYGINLEDPAERCFKAMEIELEHLSQWSAEQDIDLLFENDDRISSLDHSPGGRIRTRLRRLLRRRDVPSHARQVGSTGLAGWGVRGKWADKREAQLGEITAELRRSHIGPKWDDRRDRTEGKISAASVLHFASTRSRSVDEWEEVARMAQDLLSLATFSPCAVLRKTLIPDDAKIASDPTARSEIHVYERQLVTGGPNEPAMEPWAMLFNLSDINFGEVLPEWSEVRDMLRPTCNMILGLKYIPEGYLETKLLTAAGAAEVMESSLAQGERRPYPVPNERYKVLRKELLNLAPEEYRDWLDKKLYNAPSLQDKLKLLATDLDNQITEKLLPNVDLWAQRTSKARNDLAHRGASKNVPPLEMSAIVSVTVAVVVISLISQLGIPTSRILQALEQHPELRHAPDLARRYWPAKDPDEDELTESTSSETPCGPTV